MSSIDLTPPPERDFPTGRLQQRKEQLVSQIHAESVAGRRRRPRRVLIAAVAAAMAGILAAAAYAGYALTRPATQLATIGCYESDSLTANTAVLPSGTDSAVTTCASSYALAFPNSQPPTNFAACVLASGSVGVFPADSTSDTCKSLGLSNLAQTPGTRQQAMQFDNLEHDLDALFASNSCLSPDQARTAVRTALARNGLSSWTVKNGEGVHGEGFSPQRPCAGLAYDTTQQTVILVPETTP